MLRILTILCCLAITTFAASAQVSDASAQVSDELQALEGNYLFTGSTPACSDTRLCPETFYECNITANDKGQLLLTGFIGNVDNQDFPYYTGTYNPETQSIYFYCGADNDGEKVIDRYGVNYFVYDFTLNIGKDDEGRTTLSYNSPFWFYVLQNTKWLRASYSALTFTKDVPRPTWNGRIIQSSHADSIDDLLTYSITFETAHNIAAASSDILGIIYNENGQPYAIILVNGTRDAFGSMEVRSSTATFSFVRLSDINSKFSSPFLDIPSTTRPVTPGQATVVFLPKSFIIDGILIQDEITNVIDLKN